MALAAQDHWRELRSWFFQVNQAAKDDAGAEAETDGAGVAAEVNASDWRRRALGGINEIAQRLPMFILSIVRRPTSQCREPVKRWNSCTLYDEQLLPPSKRTGDVPVG